MEARRVQSLVMHPCELEGFLNVDGRHIVSSFEISTGLVTNLEG